MDMQLSFDPLLDLEQQFYQRGFDAGLPHGELHGLFEGRELGREKAWELCEEVGYYEGMARLWKGILAAQGKDSGRCVQLQDEAFRRAGRPLSSSRVAADAGVCSRRSGGDRTLLGHPLLASQSLDQILSLVFQFPTSNNSSSLSSSSASNADIDIPALLSSLRSKYRTACATLGVRPRLVAAGSSSATGGAEQAGEAEGGERAPDRPAAERSIRAGRGQGIRSATSYPAPTTAFRLLPSRLSPLKLRPPRFPAIRATPAILDLSSVS
ncbi:hypothetical protein BJY59DRAFT_758446 [Rhodotorula toruloides]